MEEQRANFRRAAMLIGAVGGALVGVLAARVFIKSAETEAGGDENALTVSPSKGLQIGVLVMGLLRQLSSL